MIALDTSFLLAAEGRHEARKWRIAVQVLDRLSADDLIIPAQALAEMLHALKTVFAVDEIQSGTIAARWLAASKSVPITADLIEAARRLAEDAEIGLADALIVAAAEQGGAQLLLSEDIADGLQYGQLTVIHPFVPIVHPKLEVYLGKGWNTLAASA